jgi:hypothetical protein
VPSGTWRSARLGGCRDCGHTLELAAICPGGPYVKTITEPQGPALGRLPWAVTIRALSPKLGGEEAGVFWLGPLHGMRGPIRHILNVWSGVNPAGEAARFPGRKRRRRRSTRCSGRAAGGSCGVIRIVLAPTAPARSRRRRPALRGESGTASRRRGGPGKMRG